MKQYVMCGCIENFFFSYHISASALGLIMKNNKIITLFLKINFPIINVTRTLCLG